MRSKIWSGLLQYLSAVAKPGATSSDEAFKDALASSNSLASQGDVEAALHALASMTPAAWSAAISRASPQVRSSLHAQILLLGEILASRVPVYAQTTTLLRLLIYRILPSISSLPEDDQYGTTEELMRHFKGLQFLSGVIQPTEEIPAVKDMTKKMNDAVSREAFMSNELEHARGRMKQLGISLADKTANGSKDEEAAIKVLVEKKSVAPAKYKTFALLFGILAAFLLIVAVVLVFLYVTKGKHAKTGHQNASLSSASAPVESSFATAPVETRYLMTAPDVGGGLW